MSKNVILFTFNVCSQSQRYFPKLLRQMTNSFLSLRNVMTEAAQTIINQIRITKSSVFQRFSRFSNNSFVQFTATCIYYYFFLFAFCFCFLFAFIIIFFCLHFVFVFVMKMQTCTQRCHLF
jgi:hypothetical protein